ncbi:MAG: hypothetical protein M3198_01460 [Actinomycetota bacterium]|nr:hypothetical protein [Actinomycetota bacterium]
MLFTKIYLHDKLVEEVARLRIDVSAVCQQALREEVRRAELRERGLQDLDDVVTRLREDIVNERNEQYAEGFHYGAEWARELATYCELRGIAALGAENPRSLHLVVGHSLRIALSEWEDHSGHLPYAWLGSTHADVEVGPFIQGVLDAAKKVHDAVVERL